MRQSDPLRAPERIGNGSFAFGGLIDDDGQEKWRIVRHVVNAFDGKVPFPAKVALPSALGIGRDNGEEQDTALDLLANARVPVFAAPKFALVEPNFDAKSTQGIGNALRSRDVLAGIAQEDGPRWKIGRSWSPGYASRHHFSE
jgi:hypothetical protein